MADQTTAATGPAARRRTARRRAAIGRAITLLALLPLAGRFPTHARIILGLLGDPDVPAARKALLAGALGYAMAPVDLIPDRFPILGFLDDMMVAALAVDLFLAGVPDASLERQLAAVGLDRSAFDEDVRRVRRLVPRPIRRIVNHIPAAARVAAGLAADLGLGPRVRALLDKEGSPA